MLLLKPTLACNGSCGYCYQKPIRRALNPKLDYDLKAVLAEIPKSSASMVVLHGGEPLLLPLQDMEAIFAEGQRAKKTLSIQTNGLALTDDHLSLFQRYRVSIGLSLDGPGELNRARSPLKTTERLLTWLERLGQNGLATGLIAVISKANAATNKHLGQLKAFILEMDRQGVQGRINPCISTSVGWMLSAQRLTEVYKELASFCLTHGLRWSPFSDMWNALSGTGEVVCTFRGCDPFHTSSADVVLGDGSHTNCLRVSEFFGALMRAPAQYSVRDQVLQNLPQSYGGCSGCEFWSACKGGCPCHGIDGDWRNRTQLCLAYREVFRLYKGILGFSGKEGGHGDSHGDWSNAPVR